MAVTKLPVNEISTELVRSAGEDRILKLDLGERAMWLDVAIDELAFYSKKDHETVWKNILMLTSLWRDVLSEKLEKEMVQRYIEQRYLPSFYVHYGRELAEENKR